MPGQHECIQLSGQIPLCGLVLPTQIVEPIGSCFTLWSAEPIGGQYFYLPSLAAGNFPYSIPQMNYVICLQIESDVSIATGYKKNKKEKRKTMLNNRISFAFILLLEGQLFCIHEEFYRGSTLNWIIELIAFLRGSYHIKLTQTFKSTWTFGGWGYSSMNSVVLDLSLSPKLNEIKNRTKEKVSKLSKIFRFQNQVFILLYFYV